MTNPTDTLEQIAVITSQQLDLDNPLVVKWVPIIFKALCTAENRGLERAVKKIEEIGEQSSASQYLIEKIRTLKSGDGK